MGSLLLFAALRIITEVTGKEIVWYERDKPAKAPAAAARPSDPATKAPTPAVTPAEPKADKPLVGIELDGEDDLRVSVADWPGTPSPLKKRIQHFNTLPRPEKFAQITAGMFRYGPYAMFALLPAFALLLKLVYLGRRKRHPDRPRLYGEHLIFAAHSHAFAALAIVAIALAPDGVLTAALILWLGIYLLLSQRAVYGGPWLGILARALVMFVAYSVLFGLATAGLVIAAILLG